MVPPHGNHFSGSTGDGFEYGQEVDTDKKLAIVAKNILGYATRGNNKTRD